MKIKCCNQHNMKKRTKQQKKREQVPEADFLRNLFIEQDTSTVWVCQNHVSPSGMTRGLNLYIVSKDRRLHCITASVAKVLKWPYVYKRGWLRVKGCGMDMHFYTVYTLARTLFPTGHTCIGNTQCPSNDHTNGDLVYKKGKIHKNGGYFLKHESI